MILMSFIKNRSEHHKLQRTPLKQICLFQIAVVLGSRETGAQVHVYLN